MSDSVLPIRVVALYQFTRFDDPAAVRHALARLCCGHGVKGTLLVAHEGLNGTIAGEDAAMAVVLAHIRTLPGCAAIGMRTSRAAMLPFDRLKVRLKREIVTMGQPGIDPLVDAGHHVEPADWNAMIDDPDTIVIDTRNAYEIALGSFAGAIDPHTRTFREFPDWFRVFRETRERQGRMPRVAMFCTGGIRCEKATAFLKAEGVEDVHHLKGGILAYLETVPPHASRWHGECFVFDQRVTVGQGLEPGATLPCPRCRHPATAAGCPTCATGQRDNVPAP